VVIAACRRVVAGKHPAEPAPIFTPAEWAAFIDGAKDGEFDLR
jgi:hypothetical protein